MSEQVYILVGWCSEFQEPGFEYEFKTMDEAKHKAMQILEMGGQTTLHIYQGEMVYKGKRGTRDSSYVFEFVK